MTGAVHPSPEEFRALAREYTVVPVWREVLADLETPVSAFVKLVGDRPGFLLESVEHGERWGRFSFLGANPALRVVAHGRDVTFDGAAPAGVPRDQGVLAALEALLAGYRAPVIEDFPPFHGGAVGYLGYDVVREVERLPNPPPVSAGFPDAVMIVPGFVGAFDHLRQRLWLVENVFVDGTESDAALDGLRTTAAARVDAHVAALARPLGYTPNAPPRADGALPELTTTMSDARFHDAVEVAKEYIFAGDVFQVVISKRFDLADRFDPFAVYRALRHMNPSPYMYFLRDAEGTLAGSSPETMVQLLDGRVISRPIAGTRWRGRTEEHDRRMAAELSENPKERAEHVMLVDLARNDVGRVVRFGTETVVELMAVERYSHVMHLVSRVEGELDEGYGPVDVLRATFPAGTMSGAPKVRAMEIIDELEPTRRGPYAGVVGYLDFSGNMDTAITIRTMLFRDGVASVQAGAGIVADSDPVDENLECLNKAKALLSAAAASRGWDAPHASVASAPPGATEVPATGKNGDVSGVTSSIDVSGVRDAAGGHP